MQYNVAQLLKEPTGSTRRYEIDEPLDDLDPELVIQAPITGRVKFTRIPQGVLVDGTLSTVIEVDCTRCLEAFDLPIAIDLEEQFRSYIDLRTGATLPQDEDAEDATVIDEKNIIDLSEVVRQALLLGIPARPICREACAGLCAQCGQNLNEGSCDCPDEEVDPRWESLRALLDSSDESAAESPSPS